MPHQPSEARPNQSLSLNVLQGSALPYATRPRLTIAICLGLILFTGLCYWPITHNGFVSFDDPQYILENQHVTSGLTWSGIAWAFGSGYASNWHPLTWLSHMLDCNLYGLNPAGHHLTNLLLHAAVSLLLFLLLKQATGSLWRSFLVAAFFAWHPLHVESVAWASERKDVLSAFFFLLTLLAYTRYVRTLPLRENGFNRQNPLTFYLLSLFLFALGLMSKPMLVTTPFVLLLVDFWPLNRLAVPNEKPALARLRPLLFEKIPFLALAFAASVVTFLVQKADGAVASLESHPFPLRAANAIVSYVRYLGKTFWPADLCVIYPYPKQWSLAIVLVSLFLLSFICLLVCWRVKKYPYLFTGWFWFLGMLVPTIGLVQVGRQAMADRYLYLPSIGLFVALIWGGNDLSCWLARLSGSAASKSLSFRRAITFSFFAPAAVALLACLVCTSQQAKYWHDGQALFQRALAVTGGDNAAAYDGLGAALVSAGRQREALPVFEKSVLLDPASADAQFNLGTVLVETGRAGDAIPHFETVLGSFPNHFRSHVNLGCALFQLGKLAEAEAHFSKAVTLDPGNPQPHYALGTALLAESKVEPGFAELSTAVRLNPKYVSEAIKLNPNAPVLRYNLGTILLMESHVNEAIDQLSAAVRLDPDFREAHRNLAIGLIRQGRGAEAIAQFFEVLRLNPNDPDIHADLGQALLDQNRPQEAASQFAEGLRLKPNDPKLQDRLALAQSRLKPQ